MILPSVVRSGVMPNSDLRPAVGHAEAGHHFVEDQQRPVLRGQLAQRLAGTRRVGTTQPMLPTTGSTITPAIRWPCSAKAASSPPDVVVPQHERVAGGAGGHARRVGHAQRGGRTAGRHQQAVDVAVIVAGELDDHVAGRCSRGPGGWRSSWPRCRS